MYNRYDIWKTLATQRWRSLKEMWRSASCIGKMRERLGMGRGCEESGLGKSGIVGITSPILGWGKDLLRIT